MSESPLTYRQWKAKTMAALITLSNDRGDRVLEMELKILMRELLHLKARDLSHWLYKLYHLARNEPRLLQLVPSEAQLKEWFRDN